jgi:hypothetical protein
VKVIAINRSGHAVTTTAFLDKVVCTQQVFCQPAGRITVRTGTVVHVPTGGYSVFALIHSVSGRTRSATMANVLTYIDTSTTIVLDARKGRLVQVLVDQPTAVPARLITSIDPVPGLHYAHQPAQAEQVYVLPYQQGGVVFSISAVLIKKGSTVDSPSPYIYAPEPFRTDNGVPTNPVFRIRTSALVATHSTYRSQGVAAVAHIEDFGISPDAWIFDARLPATITWYRSPHEPHGERVTIGAPIGAPGATFFQCGLESNVCQPNEVFSGAVIGPSVNRLPDGNGSRRGDTISYNAVWGFFDDSGTSHLATDNNWTGTLSLASNGTVITQTGQHWFDAAVPPGKAAYTITVDAHRTVAYSALSTHVQSVWTFSSAHTTSFECLPLQFTRYAPAGLNNLNQAPAGTTTQIPLWVERNPGDVAADVAAITVETSADDGATWQQLPLTKTATGWLAAVTSPAGPGYVSLRSTVTDSAGNTSQQTIIRAYQVR